MFDLLILFVTASPLRRFRNSQNTKRVEPITICTGIFPSRQEQYLARGAALFAQFLWDCNSPPALRRIRVPRIFFNVYH